MGPHPPIAESLWNTVPAAAQAALLDVFGSLESRIAALEKTNAELQARLNLNSTNSSKPPSTDPPAVKLKRRPPAPPSERKCGGHPSAGPTRTTSRDLRGQADTVPSLWRRTARGRSRSAATPGR